MSRQIEDELAAAEKASIADYISQSGNIAQLHNQVIKLIISLIIEPVKMSGFQLRLNPGSDGKPPPLLPIRSWQHFHRNSQLAAAECRDELEAEKSAIGAVLFLMCCLKKLSLSSVDHQVRGELSQFVDDLVVTEQLISTILETPVSEQLFLEQLQVCDS